MRSRYSALALGLVDYILQTTHPDHPDTQQPLAARHKQVSDFCQKTRFEGLDIQDSDGDFVTFRATLSQAGQDCSFTECSQFAKIDDKWFYLSGKVKKCSGA